VTISRRTFVCASAAVPLALAACGSTPASTKGPVEVSQNAEIAALGEKLLALGPGIGPEEAARMAEISIRYPLQLKADWNVTDPPLIHNTKVNMGLRPRGLCYEWADAMEARLRQENFQTFDLHRAIANSTNIRIEHSTVIASAPGGTMFEGMILDPWRYGGTLFWAPTLEDKKYKWVARSEVFAEKLRRAQL